MKREKVASLISVGAFVYLQAILPYLFLEFSSGPMQATDVNADVLQ